MRKGREKKRGSEYAQLRSGVLVRKKCLRKVKNYEEKVKGNKKKRRGWG